ncbi:hypothetical protein [Stanieria cyanosphaera]|nr:hypothetical protein [Stanieria cyanosphaera]
MTDQNRLTLDPTRPETLMEKYGIKRDAYYDRLKFLGIKHQKDSEHRCYLTDEQVNLMDELDLYIKENGKMEGFANNNSENNSGAMVKSEDTAIEQSSENIYVEPENPTDNLDVGQLIRKAAQLKARELATPDLVVRELANRMEEDDLPEDLKEKVSAVREAVNPKWTPGQLADTILAQYRSSRS